MHQLLRGYIQPKLGNFSVTLINVWGKLDTVLEQPTFVPMKVTQWHMNPKNI